MKRHVALHTIRTLALCLAMGIFLSTQTQQQEGEHNVDVAQAVPQNNPQQQVALQDALYRALHPSIIMSAEHQMGTISEMLRPGEANVNHEAHGTEGRSLLFDYIITRATPYTLNEPFKEKLEQDFSRTGEVDFYTEVLNMLLPKASAGPLTVMSNIQNPNESLTLLQAAFFDTKSHASEIVLKTLMDYGARLATKNAAQETGLHFLVRSALSIRDKEKRLDWLEANISMLEDMYPTEKELFKDLCAIDFKEPLRAWGGKSLLTRARNTNLKDIVNGFSSLCNEWKHDHVMRVLTLRNLSAPAGNAGLTKMPTDVLLGIASYTDAPKIESPTIQDEPSHQPYVPNIAEQAVRKYGEKGQFTARLNAILEQNRRALRTRQSTSSTGQTERPYANRQAQRSSVSGQGKKSPLDNRPPWRP